MKLNELIKTNHWLSVESTLLKLYPDQEKMIDDYKKIYESLHVIEANNDGELEIVLSEVLSDSEFEDEFEPYVDIFGRNKNPNSESYSINYALEFLEWDKWLGMAISKETSENFSELEIIVHCLYEMTFVDFDEQKIQEQLKSINKAAEEYKNLTEEEKKLKTISLEELKKRLDEK